MAVYANVDVVLRNSIAVVTFDRPAALNAVTTELAGETVAVLEACGQDRDIAAVILTGAGEKAFCAGVDLEQASRLEPAGIEAWFKQVSDVYRAILLIDKPVIAALNGLAAGAGFQIALVSDLRVGCARSSMSQPEINAGLPSIMGSYWMTYFLPWSLNQEMSYTGRVLDAEECLRYGLLNDLVSPDDLIERAVERAVSLSKKAPAAFQKTKARFREIALSGFDAVYAAAVAGTRSSYERGDPQRIMQAFLAKRRR
jgi:enoyl-CoA hydratase